MNVVVFGAAGKAGKLIVEEAARRGHKVVAVARKREQLAGVPAGVEARAGDATSAASVRELASGADAVVLATGSITDAGLYLRIAKAVTEALSSLPGKKPRLLHLGGGASLLAPDGTRYLDSPHFPAAWKAAAAGQADALAFYRALKNPGFTWTYFSPPAHHFQPGERKGNYRTSTDTPVLAADGSSSLSYEDGAAVFLDEIEKPRFPNQRFTAGY